MFYETNLKLSDFSNNIWKVYWQIANDIILGEQKSVLDDITVGLYLEKHPKLKKKYDEYGGYDTIDKASEYVKTENFNGYLKELQKWNTVIQLGKMKFPINDRISDYADMTIDDIYNELEVLLNHTFVNIESDVKSYNACDGVFELIDKLNEGSAIGMPLYGCNILNKEIAGFNLNGNLVGFGASSGVGKSTLTMNFIIPSVLKYNEKCVFMINEEDQTKVMKELIIWVANNVFKEELHKYVLRDGKFTKEVMVLLKKCADWIEEQKDNRNITVIPLEKYSANMVIKIINKYAALGVKLFVLDTLKESYDATTDDIFKSMVRDMTNLYDTIKPTAKNVGLWVTYQLSKASIKTRYLTNAEIGNAKSIVDLMSVNMMIRKPFADEFEGERRELKCYKLEGKNGKSKIPFTLKKDEHYMILFLPKNRFGQSDPYQIVFQCDFSTNKIKELGICTVEQDF